MVKLSLRPLLLKFVLQVKHFLHLLVETGVEVVTDTNLFLFAAALAHKVHEHFWLLALRAPESRYLLGVDIVFIETCQINRLSSTLSIIKKLLRRRVLLGELCVEWGVFGHAASESRLQRFSRSSLGAYRDERVVSGSIFDASNLARLVNDDLALVCEEVVGPVSA